MTLPGWVPRWVIRCIDFVTGDETLEALRCDCGVVIDKFPGESDEDLLEKVRAHNRFFHPER